MRIQFHFSFAAFMSFLANLLAGSLLCFFCFIHLVDRDRPVLPRDEWLHFCLLALLLALAWQFVLKVRISASSFLEMVYLVWNDLYISLPILLPKAKIFFFYFISHITLKKSLNDCMALTPFTPTIKQKSRVTKLVTELQLTLEHMGLTWAGPLILGHFSVVNTLVL